MGLLGQGGAAASALGSGYAAAGVGGSSRDICPSIMEIVGV